MAWLGIKPAAELGRHRIAIIKRLWHVFSHRRIMIGECRECGCDMARLAILLTESAFKRFFFGFFCQYPDNHQMIVAKDKLGFARRAEILKSLAINLVLAFQMIKEAFRLAR